MADHSESADLVMTGFSFKKAAQDNSAFLKGFNRIKDILFVRAGQDILFTTDEENDPLAGTKQLEKSKTTEKAK